jgi:uncharacterized protein
MKAADQGHDEAQYCVGVCYGDADGVKQDKVKALHIKAATQGNVQACLHVGECYRKGNGVKKESSKGFDWVMKAAQQGHPEAQFALVCYMRRAKQ